jgi:hypothetical protein
VVQAKPADAGHHEPGTQWTIDSLVSLFDSTREEVRSFRSQLYGSVAAAFLLPAATLAVQFRDYFKVLGGVAAIVSTTCWAIGIAVLAGGLWRLHPKLDGDDSVKDESDILMLVRMSLHPPTEFEDPLSLLTKSTLAECKVLDGVRVAAHWFTGATFLFFLAIAIEFLSFIWWGYWNDKVCP